MLAVVRAANTHGIRVTWSDADCIWLSDYTVWLSSAVLRSSSAAPAPSRLDVVAQRGLWPYDVSRRVGATASLGLYTIFPTPHALAFYEQLLARITDRCDEQKLFNYAARDLGAFMFSRKRLSYGLRQTGLQLDVTANTAGGFARPLTIGLLPYSEYPRGISKSQAADSLVEWAAYRCSGALVWHLQAPKLGKSKTSIFISHGVFALRSGWEAAATWDEALAFMDNTKAVANANALSLRMGLPQRF